MKLLDGKALSNRLKASVKNDVEELKRNFKITPGLAVILVGDDPASETYISMKSKACDEVGIYSVTHKMPSDIGESEIISTIQMINDNPNIHGLLVQLPLPKQIDSVKILEAIKPAKDVDGFHPFNVGRLVAGLDGFVPCTPLGVMRLLEEYDIDVKGMNACVVGASNIVGKPMASLLLNAGATVNICHIFTKNISEHTKKADLLIVGVGKPDLITADMVKEGAIVIDIGINKVGNRLVGDCAFDDVSTKTSYITPVPGGVGPMTIAMLLANTVKAAKLQAKSEIK